MSGSSPRQLAAPVPDAALAPDAPAWLATGLNALSAGASLPSPETLERLAAASAAALSPGAERPDGRLQNLLAVFLAWARMASRARVRAAQRARGAVSASGADAEAVDCGPALARLLRCAEACEVRGERPGWTSPSPGCAAVRLPLFGKRTRLMLCNPNGLAS